VEIILSWVIIWEEPRTLDAMIDVSMAPKTMRHFMTWWNTMHPSTSKMDDDEEEMEEDSEGYFNKDPY